MRNRIDVITEHPRLDAILESHRQAIGKQFTGYRNHCLTVYNLVRHRLELDERRDALLAIAVAHHDIALWTDDRIDYLDPSASHARAYCEREGFYEAGEVDLVVQMIQWHHKIWRKRLEVLDPLVLAMRDADWSAFTFGLIPFDRFTLHRRAIARAFPDAGFHAFLNRRALRHLLSGGVFNPLPMMRW